MMMKAKNLKICFYDTPSMSVTGSGPKFCHSLTHAVNLQAVLMQCELQKHLTTYSHRLHERGRHADTPLLGTMVLSLHPVALSQADTV